MKIAQDAARVLSTCEIVGQCVRITAGQLDRKLYLRVNDALAALGGAWDRKTKTHVFRRDPTDDLHAAIESGEVSTARELGYFPTPPALAQRIVEEAQIKPGHVILEPSAGEGAICQAVPEAARGRLVAVEIDSGRARQLRAAFPSSTVIEADFLTLGDAMVFDRIVMNPPFAIRGRARADLDHVLRAHAKLGHGGKLVAVMSAGIAFREDTRSRDFRAMVTILGGSITPIEDGAFKTSGTDVRTVLVSMPPHSM